MAEEVVEESVVDEEKEKEKEIEEIEIAFNSNDFEPKDYVSPSQLRAFKGCPTRWYDSNVFKDLQPASGPAVFGDAMHLCIERLSKRAMEEMGGKTGNFTIEQVFEEWLTVLALYPAMVDIVNIDRGKKQLTYWLAQEQLRDVTVIDVEKVFFCYMPNGLPIRGIIDRIETNCYTSEGFVQLIDWKSGFLRDDYEDSMTIYKAAGFTLYRDSNVLGILVTIYQLENEYFENYDISREDISKYAEYALTARMSMLNFVSKVREFVKDKDIKGLHGFIQQQAKFNKFCYACRLSASCGQYIKQIYSYVPAFDTNSIEGASLDFLIQQEEHLTMVAKGASSILDRIDTVIMDILSKKEKDSGNRDGVELVNGGRVVITARSARKFRSEVIYPLIFKYKLISMFGLTLGNLDEAIKVMDPEDKEIAKRAIFKVLGKDSWKVISAKQEAKKKK